MAERPSHPLAAHAKFDERHCQDELEIVGAERQQP
jgi:hypothetical protein